MTGRELVFAEFRLRPQQRELLRDGRPIRLEKIPFDLLVLLVERGGDLVPRDEIAARLWQANAFQDIDASLNTAIRKIRLALRDSSDRPRFVQTVIGQGYRFLAPVEVLEMEAPTASAPESDPVATVDAPRPNGVLLVGAAFVLITVLGWFMSRQWQGQGTVETAMIAVLPFDDLGTAEGDVSQRYFSQGVTEEIITELGRTASSGISVIAGPSVWRYRGQKPSAHQLATELGAGYILSGSVQRQASTLRIRARLIRTRDEVQLWSESFDGDATEVLTLEQSVAISVARAVAAQFRRSAQTNQGSGSGSRPRPISAEAYDLYLRGRFYWNQRSESSLKQAIDYFRQAVTLAPDYAPAHAAIADAYAQLVYGCYLAPAEGFGHARDALGRARTLDPASPELLASEGYLHMYFDWDFAAAQRKFEEAILSNPNYAPAYDWLGVLFTAMEKPGPARAALERAYQLDPGSLPIATDLGFHLHYSGRNKQAEEALRQVLSRDPNFGPAHFWMGRVLNAEGDCRGARLELASVPAALQQWQPLIAARGYVAGACGDPEGTASSTKLLDEAAKSRFVTSYGRALIEAGAGHRESALFWLGKAVEERSHWMVWIRLDPRFLSLRNDPKFRELAAKVFSRQ